MIRSRSSSSLLASLLAAALVVACGGPSETLEQAPGSSTRTLTSKQRAAMLAQLKSEAGPTKDVWFATDSGNPEAAAFQKALQEVFEEAGWHVRGNSPIPFSMKPGIYFLVGDSDPPEYVNTAYGALSDAAGISLGGG